MILEAAMLNVKNGMEQDFEAAFKQASKIISRMGGYIFTNYTDVSNLQASIYYWFNGATLNAILWVLDNQRNIKNGRGCYITFTTHFLQ